MDITSLPRTTGTANATGNKGTVPAQKADNLTGSSETETKMSYKAVSRDGDTLEISEKPAINTGKVTISDAVSSVTSTKYSSAALAKLPKQKLKQLLTDGQITKQQYDKAAR